MSLFVSVERDIFCLTKKVFLSLVDSVVDFSFNKWTPTERKLRIFYFYSSGTQTSIFSNTALCKKVQTCFVFDFHSIMSMILSIYSMMGLPIRDIPFTWNLSERNC